MLNNSNSTFILDLFRDYEMKILQAKIATNSNASKRGYIKKIKIHKFCKFVSLLFS